MELNIMKKYTNIFVALGVTMFLLTVGMKSEADGQHCKGITIVDTVTVDGCEYELELCALCRYAYPGEISNLHYKNIGPCSTTLNPDQVFQGIMSQISTYAYLWFDHCVKNIPPCNGTERREITFNIPICWHAKLIVEDPIDPDNNIYLYEQCVDEAECYVTYSYCKDAFNNVQKEVKEFYSFGTPDCKLEAEYVVLPTALGDSSDCYHIHTPCNPY